MSSLSDVKDVADQRKTGTVRISDVSHRYGRGRDEVTALGPVDLTVEPGSFLVLVGASGCGKSTLLRLMAGFESPSEGAVQVSGSAPDTGSDRWCGVPAAEAVPVANGRRKRRSGAEVRRTCRGNGAPSDETNCWSGWAWRALPTGKIWEISGGQQQRVAIARALAAETPLFLLDEPFAALDALTRERLQEDVRQVSAEIRPHDSIRHAQRRRGRIPRLPDRGADASARAGRAGSAGEPAA